MCWANLELSPLFFMSHTCSLNLVLNVRPVCSVYICGQFAHWNWHIRLRLYFPLLFSFVPNKCFILFLVLYDISISIFFNNILIVLLSGPKKVKIVQFLFYSLFFSGISSLFLLLRVIGNLFIRLICKFIAAFLCSYEWHELLCMIKSVVVGFL
jgi:hypothetical protein